MNQRQALSALAVKSAWTAAAVRRPEAKVRLYCLPFLGGSADFYLPLARQLPPWVETVPVELPGYGRRNEGPSPRSLPALAHSLLEMLTKDAMGKPSAVFGHCGGGLVAYEMTRQLQTQAVEQPVLLGVSSTPPPHQWQQLLTRMKHKPLTHLMPLTREVARDPVYRQAGFRGLFSGEAAVYRTYRPEGLLPLECPVSVFGGREDPVIWPEALSAWSELSNAEVRKRIYPGEHFYLTTHWPQVARSLALDLDAALHSPPSARPSEGSP
ncbi:alpha/beta fold hydrolase [Streptomyces sp. DT2A-34]|uniref:thioesterase II family protein n=1 Tax=Streptomyces sp. DT2A-34 TaxID=3051182 RepID=UPI00265BB83D|nr:alpha/beta fold hydrolase [Streptomyces sp. DT2A-34]MDO0909339.1 alpha/beta fold hydrolase [Streptomyces sp. DT2A-34]